MLDEDALQIGSRTLVQFVLDNQGGIDAEKLFNADERNHKA